MKTSTARYEQLRVLVVDDEWLAAMRHSEVLSNAGVGQATFKCNFDAAVSCFEESQAWIVLPDVRLGAASGDGFYLMETLRQIAQAKGWPEPFGIFITGVEVEESREKVKRMPGSILLEKPVSDAALLAAFDQVVNCLPEWQKQSLQSSTSRHTVNGDLSENVNPEVFTQGQKECDYKHQDIYAKDRQTILVSIDAWHGRETLYSVSFPFKTAIGNVLALFNKYLTTIKDLTGQVVAQYAIAEPKRYSTENCEVESEGIFKKRLHNLKEAQLLTLESISLPAVFSNFSSCNPNILSVESTIGDMHVILNDGFGAADRIVVNVANHSSFASLGSFWLAAAHHNSSTFHDIIAAVKTELKG